MEMVLKSEELRVQLCLKLAVSTSRLETAQSQSWNKNMSHVSLFISLKMPRTTKKNIKYV